jgi:hypothetical protein
VRPESPVMVEFNLMPRIRRDERKHELGPQYRRIIIDAMENDLHCGIRH